MTTSELTTDCFEAWDRFCLESDDAWFWHTTKWLNYCTCYGDVFEARNLSFLITDDTGIVAICPLLLEKKTDDHGVVHHEFSTSGSGGPGIVPALRNGLSEDRRERIYKAIYEKVDALAQEFRVVRGAFRGTPLAASRGQYNTLLKYGYLDSTLNTQIIELTTPLEMLWSGLRKGHKYDTHRGEKYYQVHLYGPDNPDKEAFDEYRLLHHKAAGRVTRPLETFEMMYSWICSGEGMLCGVSRDGQFAGFSFIILYKDGAYYASASDDPDFETDVPISHVIQWKTITWLKEKGIKTYEIGLQQFGPQLHDCPASKDQSISFFKRGFGGKTVPLFRGVRYYNMEFMEADLNSRLKRLLLDYRV